MERLNMAEQLSPWAEQRPPRTEAERHEFAAQQSKHLPKMRDGGVWSDEDVAAMKAAFAARFNEDLPRTETLFAVAAIGYRIAMRDLTQ
jgi:hypothetical protein